MTSAQKLSSDLNLRQHDIAVVVEYICRWSYIIENIVGTFQFSIIVQHIHVFVVYKLTESENMKLHII